MKLYNNRNLIKIASIIFIVLSSIYVLYIFNYEYRTLENFANKLDCSNCTVKPSSGNCIPLYDISYTYSQIGTTNKYRLDICNIITNNVFCSWESQCLFDNISTIDESIFAPTCCSGSSFYDNSYINFNYSVIQDNTTNITDCSNIKDYVTRGITGAIDLSYDELIFNRTNEICNTLDTSNKLYNTRGMLFYKAETSTNIFTDPTTMPKDILTFISFSNIRNEIRAIISGARSPQILPASLNGFNDISLTNIENELKQINNSLMLKERNENIRRQMNRSDLTSIQSLRLGAIITNLQQVYRVALPNTLLQERKIINYNLVKNSKQAQSRNYDVMSGTQYLLNSDQFYNCMGEIKYDNSGSFSEADLAELSNNDFFGTAGRPIALGGLGEASYNALGSMMNNGFPNNTDLEMELKRLETIPASGNAPVSIISTYLNSINSFYEKQIKNLTGPREHTFNQELIFDNNTLKTKESTFFTYNKDENNVYTCQDSITGDPKFKYCGPQAYYDIPNF
jgi:hypothetical protein